MAFVLDHEDALAEHLLGDDVREVHVERRSFALFALEADRAVHLFHESLRQGETESRPGCLRTALVETFEHAEDSLARHVRDPDPRVSDLETQVAAFDECTEPDVTAARRELHGVRDEVEEHLAHACRIEEERPCGHRLHREEHASRLRGGAPCGRDRLHEHVEREDLGP